MDAQLRMLARRAGVSDPKLVSKTAEYVRLATSRLSGGSLGQGEVCKAAACMELASQTLGVPLEASVLRKSSGVSEQVYRNTKATLQKLLGVGTRTTSRELCVQFGCARHEPSVKAALAAYKERFVRRLPAAQQGHVDFSRPVFLATAFYLVARKNRVQVDKNKLLQPLGVTTEEFAQVHTSMAELISELVGVDRQKLKRKAEGGANRELLDATGGRDDDDEECSSSEEEGEEEGMVGHRVNKKKQQQREYEAWKEAHLKPGAKKPKLTEKGLRQATLSFAAPGAKEAAAGQEQAAGGKALQEKNA